MLLTLNGWRGWRMRLAAIAPPTGAQIITSMDISTSLFGTSVHAFLGVCHVMHYRSCG